MLHTKNTQKLLDKGRLEKSVNNENDDEEELNSTPTLTESTTYAITVTKKPLDNDAGAVESDEVLCTATDQKSFISIHSTDQLCHVEAANPGVPEECNLEVLSHKDVFPSSSEESLSHGGESPVHEKKTSKKSPKSQTGENETQIPKSLYVPTNTKSSIMPSRFDDSSEGQTSGFSDFDIPSKNTMYVIGSNPGEPKMNYPDPPKKISKTMKKLLRNIDKYKNEQGSKSGEKSGSKLKTFRSILKDSRCAPECTGDSMQSTGDDINLTDISLAYPIDWSAHMKHRADKNVTFNTEVVMIHFRGALCVGQSVEALSKEKEQQERNSELRKTYLAKYNEFWHAPK